jgi:hypothetical protein
MDPTEPREDGNEAPGHPTPEGARPCAWSPRERAKAICNNMFTGHATLYLDEIAEEIQKAVEIEREACAEIAESLTDDGNGNARHGHPLDIARQIRAREWLEATEP